LKGRIKASLPTVLRPKRKAKKRKKKKKKLDDFPPKTQPVTRVKGGGRVCERARQGAIRESISTNKRKRPLQGKEKTRGLKGGGRGVGNMSNQTKKDRTQERAKAKKMRDVA